MRTSRPWGSWRSRSCWVDRFDASEFPNHLPTLLNDARERTALGEEQPLSQPLRDWLSRALQLDTRRAFASAPEALSALEEIVADDSMYVAAPVSLETFLSRYIAAVLELPTDPIPAPQAAVFVPATMYAATPIVPADVHLPAVAPAASHAAAFEALSSPLASAPAAATLDAWADAAPTDHGTTPRDITELIAAADLKVKPSDPAMSLFNPEAPFMVDHGAQFGSAQAAPFIPVPAAKAAPESKAARKPTLPPISRKAVLVAAALIIIAGGGLFAYRFMTRSGVATPSLGTLVVQSNPAGVQVFVDGVDRGQTPARLSVPAGAHILELRGRGVPRVIPLSISAGAEVSQSFEFANTPETGSLRVESQPAGAKVLVDGTDRGVAPVTINDLLPGDHEVVLQTPIASARHVVSVQAGGTASLVTPVASAASAAGPVSGWLMVKAPFSLEIREGGTLIGTTEADRLMLAAGRHDIELVNETLGYRVTRVVQVMPGKVANLAVELPRGIVNLNATPWAEVWIDGQRVGETPIGNLSIAIGSHEVLFRHPQFGEKRHAISVTMSAPTRLSVDMK